MPGDVSSNAIAGSIDYPLHVLIIGAGLSGVCAGIKLLKKGVRNFRIVEKSNGIGGTWYDNRYPGAACDVASHFYCYSFERNPDWSRVYSPQAEIEQYIRACADKYGVTESIHNGVKIECLRFNEASGIWQADVADGSAIFARFVINAAGGLHKAAYPDIEGRGSFSGPAMHTAHWNPEVGIAGKRIGVIGSAASAIQLIPEIAKIASQVTVFQRTPNYIAPRNDRAYTEKEKRRFERWPFYAKLYRWFLFVRMELLLFPITKTSSRLGKTAAAKIVRYMRSVVSDKATQEKLVPDYQLGCKRILISDDFYASLNRENVELVSDPVRRISEDSIHTSDGRAHPIDVLVYATGFDIDAHILSIEVTGAGNEKLADRWNDLPAAYHGCAVNGFPNYFMVTGPNTGVATTSLIFMIEHQLDYILQLMDLAAGAGGRIQPTKEAEKLYNRKLQEEFKGTVWISGCDSWYRREDGRIATLYPYNARHFRRACKRVDKSDFEVSVHAAAANS